MLLNLQAAGVSTCRTVVDVALCHHHTCSVLTAAVAGKRQHPPHSVVHSTRPLSITHDPRAGPTTQPSSNGDDPMKLKTLTSTALAPAPQWPPQDPRRPALSCWPDRDGGGHTSTTRALWPSGPMATRLKSSGRRTCRRADQSAVMTGWRCPDAHRLRHLLRLHGPDQ